ncbi:hypothetical protein SAMN05216326_12214 [Nitrosomonas marina]|uniref:Short C-terminal domain-containing protein n=1 Tax=Nitrosomonas marina TaxID=917 RepID=A0A1I0DRB8_9PROT|nr:hypothetical protein [Nitrosomonas marina]SET35106.1 hypothetical protein SAMN05216326_12214 [Nitrosomonas marina]
MSNKLELMLILIIFCTITGCAALVGAGAAGGAYEYQNKRQLDELEREFSDGIISREEYLKRKKQINEGSVIY